MDQLKVENGISLHFQPAVAAAPSLEQQVQQLITQRGALRKITKLSLQKEIDQPKFEDIENEANDEVDNETPQARQERIRKSREEIMQRLAYAQNEILSTLDFVSLLLSGSSTAAQTSMSPALKQLVPVGTVKGQKVEGQDISTANRSKLLSVSEGWKLESFKSASVKLNQAANRLDNEASRQSKYWDQIAKLKNHGWSVSRLPSDSRAVVVHYGFPDASPQFRNRGFAVLQQDEAGDLQLDARSIPERFTSNMVVIVRDGIETGFSQSASPSADGKSSVIDQIRTARDTVFEDELFYEISREARLLANQDTYTQSEAVEARIGSSIRLRIVKIDLKQPPSVPSNARDNDLADFVALSMRMLLLLEHDRLKKRRSTTPHALSNNPRILPEYAILRPVLAYLRHQASLVALRSICEAFHKTFASAGIVLTFQITQLGRDSQNGDQADSSALTLDMQNLRLPVRSLLAAQLNNGRRIEAVIETYLGSPVYGTTFRSHSLDFDFVQFQSGSFNTLDETSDYLSRAFTLELMSQTTELNVLKPHSGDVALRNSKNVTAAIGVRPDRLTLRVTSQDKEMYSWRDSEYRHVPDEETNKSRTFGEVIKILVGKV